MFCSRYVVIFQQNLSSIEYNIANLNQKHKSDFCQIILIVFGKMKPNCYDSVTLPFTISGISGSIVGNGELEE